MSDTTDRNTEKLLKLRRLGFAQEELRAERVMREAMRGVVGANGHAPSRTIERIVAYGEVKVAGKLPRRFIEMKNQKVPLDQALRVLDELREWVVKDLWGESSGAKKVG